MEKNLEKIVNTHNRMIQEGAKKYEIARELGFVGDSNCDASSALNKKLKKASKQGYDVVWSKDSVVQDSGLTGWSVRDKNMSKLTYSNIPSKSRNIDEIIADRVKEFKRVKASSEAEDFVTIDVDDRKPIGLVAFGDIDVDNLGTNFPKVLQDVETTKNTDGMWGIDIGDDHDNWIGYLSKLYAKNGTTRDEAFKLLEYLISEVPWLFMIAGNHDCWQGMEGRDRLVKENNVLSFDSQANIDLKFPNGNSFKLFARHNFPGKSQWSGVLGLVKWAKLRGNFDILFSGHIHSCGYEWVVKKNLSENKYHISHCEQLGSYKQYADEFSKDKGFEDTNVTPSVMYILNPNTDDPTMRCMRFPNVQQGAEYLTYLRSK